MREANSITATTTVREVMTHYPHLEAVFNRHGLTGCGSPRGPMEPVAFFATVHHVDPEVLLRELNEAARKTPEQPQVVATQATAVEPDIYRIFVKTALAIVITVGCSLGAVNLAAMALAGVTGSYWEAVTQAHGHAQIFGWVGLFIMGVAYHVLPRLKATQLQGRALALASFWLVLSGIVLRMISQPLADLPSFAGIVVLSAVAELAGASLFVYVVVRTLASNPASADFWDKYVLAGAAWFWISAAATVAISLYAAALGVAVIPAAIDGPYLHVALMGFVTMTIFGIALRTIPVFMGLKAPSRRVFDAIFWALNLSIVLKAGSGWLRALLPGGGFAVAGYVAAGLEYGSILAFIYFLGVLGKPVRDVREEGARVNYERFIRAAFFWLGVAGTMSAAYAIYQAITGQPVSHSLVGAYRHALTVGFISMIIIGMAARIIPVFAGVRLHSDLMLLATFVLINLGNTVRVVTQPLADLWGGPLFLAMGVSGFIEVIGLALFVYNLWRTMDSPVEEDSPVPSSGRSGAIGPDTIVADALKLRPEALGVLVSYGFGQLHNPIGRRTMARAVTVAQAAQMKGVDLEALLRDLNGGGANGAESRADAPVERPVLGTVLDALSGGTVSRELVMMALRSCYDPEIPVNIVDLGLVNDVRIEGGSVCVELTPTAPECPMGQQMADDVREVLSQLPGVEEVQVDLAFDPPWTPDRMSDVARRQLGTPTAG